MHLKELLRSAAKKLYFWFCDINHKKEAVTGNFGAIDTDINIKH